MHTYVSYVSICTNELVTTQLTVLKVHTDIDKVKIVSTTQLSKMLALCQVALLFVYS